MDFTYSDEQRMMTSSFRELTDDLCAKMLRDLLLAGLTLCWQR